MQESPTADGQTILRGDSATPFKDGNALQVTPEELNGIRALIRHLKPGVYIKCSKCERLKYTASVYFVATDVICGRCYQ